MIITNKLNLPAPLVKAVTRPPREAKPNRIGVTELTQPPQLRGLTRRHEGELTEDASDRLWALLGSLLHDVLEGYAEGLDNTIAEQKLEIEIDGWTVVGKYDLSEMILEGELLTDWKLTSVYSLRDNDAVKPEWEAQINCYVYLLGQHGRTVTKAQIVAIGRDWNKSRARRERDYPQKGICIKPVVLWPAEQTLAYIKERVRLHKAAEQGVWPECNAEDRWARPDIYALMKKGQKKAVKLYQSKHAAEFAVARDQYIVERPGESTRCEAYCPVSNICEQFKREKEAKSLLKQLENSVELIQNQAKEKTNVAAG